jgi:hypothetical protein
MIKYEPVADLENLRQCILIEVRKYYVSLSFLINNAYKPYVYWINLAAEERKSIIRKCATSKCPSILLN